MPAISFDIEAKNATQGAVSAVKGEIKGVEDAAASAKGHVQGFGQSMSEAEGHAGRLHSALGSVASVAGGMVLGGGLLALPGHLLDFAKGAADDEAATLRLQQSIRNLGGDYDATNKQVNDAIASGQKLGFTDDDIRDSFIKLSTATGDSDEALRRQKVAMELARGAHIDLGDASKLLGKLTDENLQVFKKMGITLPDVASSADVLAAVQAKFGGQADAYAKSTAGQFQQAKIALSETGESIGYIILPAITKLAQGTAAVLPHIQDFVGMLSEKLGPVIGHVADGVVQLAQGLETRLAPVIQSRVIPVVTQVINLFETLSGGVIGTLISGVQLVAQHWDQLTARFPILQQVLDAVLPRLQAVGAWFQAVAVPYLQTLIPLIQAWIAQMADRLVPILQTAWQWLDQHRIVLVALGAVLATLTFGPILVGLAAVIAVVVEAKLHWQEITQRISAFADMINQRFPEVTKFITQVQTFFTGLWTFLTTQFAPGVQAVISGIVDFIQEHWAGIKDLLTGPFEIAKALVVEQLHLIRDAVSLIFTDLGDILAIFGDLFSGNWSKLWSDVKLLVTDTLSGIKALIGDQLTAIEGVLSGAWDTVKAVAGQVWNEIGDTIETALHDLWAWIQAHWAAVLLDVLLGPIWAFRDQILGVIEDAGKNVASALGGIYDTITGWASDAGTWLLSAGESIISGLVQGFTNKFDDVKNSLGDLKDKIVSWKGPPWEDAVLLEPTGGLIVQGLLAGMEAAYPAVEQSLTDFTSSLVTTAQHVGGAIAAALQVGGSAGGGGRSAAPGGGTPSLPSGGDGATSPGASGSGGVFARDPRITAALAAMGYAPMSDPVSEHAAYAGLLGEGWSWDGSRWHKPGEQPAATAPAAPGAPAGPVGYTPLGAGPLGQAYGPGGGHGGGPVNVNVSHVGGAPVATSTQSGTFGATGDEFTRRLLGQPGQAGQNGWGWYGGRYSLLTGGVPTGLSGYQHGGYVPETGPAMLHAGEYVVPAGRAAGGPTFTIHIHALDASGMRQAIPELVRQISRHLQQIGQAPLVPGTR